MKIDENGFVYEIKDDTVTITGYNDNKKNVEVNQIQNTTPEFSESDLDIEIDDLIEEFLMASDTPRGNKKRLEIPKIIGGLKVTHIECNAFRNKNILEIIIPDSVVYIGINAFSQNKLTEIVLPDSIIHIESYAFFKNKLTEILIPNSLTHIGGNAFRENELTKITFPDSITHIGEYAFYNNKLTEITIPKSVIYIGEGAFSNNNIPYDKMPQTAGTYTKCRCGWYGTHADMRGEEYNQWTWDNLCGRMGVEYYCPKCNALLDDELWASS